jgi:hypothetical protein
LRIRDIIAFITFIVSNDARADAIDTNNIETWITNTVLAIPLCIGYKIAIYLLYTIANSFNKEVSCQAITSRTCVRLANGTGSAINSIPI